LTRCLRCCKALLPWWHWIILLL